MGWYNRSSAAFKPAWTALEVLLINWLSIMKLNWLWKVSEQSMSGWVSEDTYWIIYWHFSGTMAMVTMVWILQVGHHLPVSPDSPLKAIIYPFFSVSSDNIRPTTRLFQKSYWNGHSSLSLSLCCDFHAFWIWIFISVTEESVNFKPKSAKTTKWNLSCSKSRFTCFV